MAFQRDTVIEFIDDDEGYLAWIRDNPAEFVVNISKIHAASESKSLHRANCYHISNLPAGTTTWTTGMYKKVCGYHADALEHWATRNSIELGHDCYCLQLMG